MILTFSQSLRFTSGRKVKREGGGERKREGTRKLTEKEKQKEGERENESARERYRRDEGGGVQRQGEG